MLETVHRDGEITSWEGGMHAFTEPASDACVQQVLLSGGVCAQFRSVRAGTMLHL